MNPRQEQGTADLRGLPRKARETSNRFADEDLRLENQQLRDLNRDLERSLASRTAQLAAANRLKSDLLALLSHEFRTPLQAIFGYTELLEREIHGPLTESQRRDILRIQQSEQQLLGLISAILDFAKLESGQSVELSLYPTAVHGFLVQLEALVKPLDS